jgi:hypothetical protein
MISDIECPKWLKLLGYMSAETIQSYSTKLKDGDKEYRRYWQIPTEDFEKSNGVAFVCKLMTARYRLKSADSHYPING